MKELVNFPEERRDECNEILASTFRNIDITLNMVILRLGSIRDLKDEDKFIEEVKQLDNDRGWLKAEREFRLCESLTRSLREMETLGGQMDFSVSTKNWNFLLETMRFILAREGQLADFIAAKFSELSKSTEFGSIDNIRANVVEFRDRLISERNDLIDLEIKMRQSI